MKQLLIAIAFFLSASVLVSAQVSNTSNFRSIVETNLKEKYQLSLDEVCQIDTDSVTMRVFREYGAVFVAKNVMHPYRCIFDSDAEVQLFQQWATYSTELIGGVSVTLQPAAMAALIAARQEATKKRLTITPRGGASASTRSYTATVGLWRSRFDPALRYWTKKGRIKKSDADSARRMPIRQQIAAVLKWEESRLYFSKDLSKSILYSVAAPGASQHTFMLALDVEQFANPGVRTILARHGWFQTVQSDLPHFTFLGVPESELNSLGLKPVTVSGQKFWIPNIE